MGAKIVPKGITDPEERLFLQQLAKSNKRIVPLAIPEMATPTEAIVLLEAKLNELIIAWNKQ